MENTSGGEKSNKNQAYDGTINIIVEKSSEVPNNLYDSVNGFTRALKSLQNSIALLVPQNPLIGIASLSMNLSKQISSSLTGINLNFTNIFQPLQELFKDLSPRVQKALLIMGNHGWYLDIEMPLDIFWEFENEPDNENFLVIEAALKEHFIQHLDIIENRIIDIFPHRTKIIKSAFKAHRNSDYELSIPVFLSQTDGICFEVTKNNYFKKNGKKPATADYFENLECSEFRKALLSPLTHPLPISASEKDRGESFTELNRHQILHGEVLDYGTEINSLKCISLLNYVVQALKIDKD